jgi:uncharacterized protein (DUF1697 family)
MHRFVALLRGLNVGGHRLKMDRLRALFEEEGFTGVSTYIASGNVIFDADSTDARAVERRIEARLEAALGYAVPTFLRTPGELAHTAAFDPFPAAGADRTLMVSFHRAPPTDELRARLNALRTPSDDFRAEGREVYWLTAARTTDSPVGAQVAKALAGGTMRNGTTVLKLAALANG